MAKVKVTRLEHDQNKIRNVPIAVTPEGFWCCPSPVGFQKTLKSQNSISKSKNFNTSSKTGVEKKHNHSGDKNSPPTPLMPGFVPVDHTNLCSDVNEKILSKVAIEFGEPSASDVKVILHGKQGFLVKMNLHRNVLVRSSRFFADKLLQTDVSIVEIVDCEDVEIYVETVGLMYCKEMKHRLIKQSVSKVLLIVKVAELLGFDSCIRSCLEYLEAVPWVGEEEEEKVVSSVLRLQREGIGGVAPILKRVLSDVIPCKATLSQIMQLVLNSTDEKSRREMKSVLIKLLKDNNSSNHIYSDTIYSSCNSSLKDLVSLFREASEPDFSEKHASVKDPVTKRIALEADNITWLVEILCDRHAADEFALMWSDQQELSSLHVKLTLVSRHHISRITATLFVRIGRGDVLPCKDTRKLLLQTWLQPLIRDYGWLRHSCRSFDRTVVDEGIEKVILTLPLQDQQTVLLAWLNSFLKSGDNCPNLQRAFEIWWRRTFIRPYKQAQTHMFISDGSTASR